MKILITGGAGFIGSHVADVLVRRGDRVFTIDNYTTGRFENTNERTFVFDDNIANGLAVREIFESIRPDVVVHAAASYDDPDNWFRDATTNVCGTINAVKISDTFDVKRFVYLQTALCYGLKPETQPIPIDHVLNPVGSFAISKVAGERYVMESDLDWVSLRLANVYGPRSVSGPVPAFWKRLSEGKECFVADSRRDFIYVDDVIRVIVKAIDGKGESGVYHVATGQDCPILTLYQEIVAAMGLDMPDPEVQKRSPDDAATILLDATETRVDFDWDAVTPLDFGVRKAIAWYEEWGVEKTFTHLGDKDNGNH